MENIEEDKHHQLKKRAQLLLYSLVGEKYADVWWGSPNKAFNMRTPAAVWLEDPEKVYNYLLNHVDYTI